MLLKEETCGFAKEVDSEGTVPGHMIQTQRCTVQKHTVLLELTHIPMVKREFFLSVSPREMWLMAFWGCSCFLR